MVSHLCSKNTCPNKADVSKAIHLLRYLASPSAMGPVFKSSSTVIYAHADAAFGVHTDGFSSSAHFLPVGETNASFVS